ncbi:sialate O-acetylesterase [soil metagenome]
MKVFKKSIFHIFYSICLLSSFNGLADVQLPKIFQNNMVIQRNSPLKIWGRATPGEKINITFNGENILINTDKKGKWIGQFTAMPEGGPYEIIIKGQNLITLKEILIGDVWICSGQSNMQWSISQTPYQEKDSAFINQSKVRFFTVAIESDYIPKEEISNGSWKTLGEKDIDEFSAVGYHFGKYLYQNVNVPIGLINVSLGATSIETWMSNDALINFPQFKEVVGPIMKEGKSFDQLKADFEKMKPEWFKNYYFKGPGVEQEWFKPETDVTDWKPMEISGNNWENTDLSDFDGAVWFRTSFDLPDNFDQDNFFINLLQIDDYDLGWVNGIKVGEHYGRHNHRGYNVPKDILKPKGNILVIRVFDTGGIGGFTTSSFWGNPILKGSWVYKKGLSIIPDKFIKPNVPNATPFSSPGILFNANIAPLTFMGIKGVIWYQGEANAERAYEYRELFPALIKDWRRNWQQEDLPFLFVQLANYGQNQDNGSSWAELREAQSMALKLPFTGMATAIDIGEPDDIHPKNKEEVGRRLGLAALKIAYDEEVVFSGPTFKEMFIEDEKVFLSFNHIGGALITKDKHGYVRGFKIAGEDKVFHWAKAYIEGDKVVVYHDQTAKPVAVRYAWDNNPGPLDLYNLEGLPAVPFRTDTWEGLTDRVVFTDGPRF